jgi:hypothetical protein
MNAPIRQSSYVRELCIALAHRWEPERIFVILTAYLDESGTHGDSPITVMAGVMANATQWARFEAEFVVRHQQTIATNKRSTSAAAQRPPAAPQSAAQAAGAARAPRRSISHAHRSPQARAGHHHRGHAFSWQRICDLRRAQLEAWRAGQVRQLTLFELKDDSRPSAELCAWLAAFEASRRFRP